VEAEKAAGVADFDARYAARLAGLTGPVEPQDDRRRHIEALVTQGATEGERAAALAALQRFDTTHRELNNMHRGGNWIDEP
jgi:hypothetical protein